MHFVLFTTTSTPYDMFSVTCLLGSFKCYIRPYSGTAKVLKHFFLPCLYQLDTASNVNELTKLLFMIVRISLFIFDDADVEFGGEQDEESPQK
jgi:hypothetical protein